MNEFIRIDMRAVENLAQLHSATEGQMKQAYRSALKKTARYLNTRAKAIMKDDIQPKGTRRIGARLKMFMPRSGAGQFDEVKLWFGLNPVPVSQIKGKITGKRRKHHSRRDPTTGRYIKARSRKASDDPAFNPAAGDLKAQSYPNGFITRGKSGRSIYTRSRHKLHEAQVDIADPVIRDIKRSLVKKIPEVFMKNYERDLAFFMGKAGGRS